MPENDQKEGEAKLLEDLTGKVQLLNAVLDNLGDSERDMVEIAQDLRDEIKSIKADYSQISKGNDFPELREMIRTVDDRVKKVLDEAEESIEIPDSDIQLIESPEVDLDANWVDKVVDDMRSDPVLKALFFGEGNETEQDILENLRALGFRIESVGDLKKLVQGSVRAAHGKEISEEDALNISEIIRAMENERSLAHLKAELEIALQKTAQDSSPVLPSQEVMSDSERRSELFELNLKSMETILTEAASAEERESLEKRLLVRMFGSSVNQPTNQAPLEGAPQKPTVEDVVEMLKKDKSLQMLIHDLEGLRLTLQDREDSLKFGLIPEGFESNEQFVDSLRVMEKTNDPILSADSIEDLLASHVRLSLKTYPNLLSAWDPESSPEKVQIYFKNLWNKYLKTNKPKFYG